MNQKQIEILARELCFEYRRGRLDENLSYCRFSPIEDYINEHWHQFKHTAELLVVTLEKHD